MDSIITATVLLGIVHALIPNHWLPLVAIAKVEKWPKGGLIMVTFVASFAHVLGTVLLGFILGWIGIRLAETYRDYLHGIAPVLFILIGLLYSIINLPHHRPTIPDGTIEKKSSTKWIIIFVLIMFLSPCLEVETMFLAAGAYGVYNVLWLGAVYALVSVSGITATVLLAFMGVKMIRAEFIERNEKRITGFVLITVGIVTYFIH